MHTLVQWGHWASGRCWAGPQLHRVITHICECPIITINDPNIPCIVTTTIKIIIAKMISHKILINGTKNTKLSKSFSLPNHILTEVTIDKANNKSYNTIPYHTLPTANRPSSPRRELTDGVSWQWLWTLRICRALPRMCPAHSALSTRRSVVSKWVVCRI